MLENLGKMTLKELMNAPYGMAQKIQKDAQAREQWDNIKQYCKQKGWQVNPHFVFFKTLGLTIAENGNITMILSDGKEYMIKKLSLSECRRFVGILTQFNEV